MIVIRVGIVIGRMVCIFVLHLHFTFYIRVVTPHPIANAANAASLFNLSAIYASPLHAVVAP